ncbi:hypothetical protein MRB53_018805 [Persea americana]|uniref:Uncharacterized protein n=1 Tax=Persea americana TaxID=3435 RepID=A0ACC2M9U3_PERAE|nr:hypothetical protein MRB53_018805 [Persea americana]
MEGFVEVSPLSSAPTSASSDSLIISNDSYVPIHSSSQILVAQDSKELINVEHSEAAVSHTNEKHMNDEKLGKKGRGCEDLKEMETGFFKFWEDEKEEQRGGI